MPKQAKKFLDMSLYMIFKWFGHFQINSFLFSLFEKFWAEEVSKKKKKKENSAFLVKFDTKNGLCNSFLFQTVNLYM